MEINRNRQIHRDYFKRTGLNRAPSSKHLFWSERLKATPSRVRILDILKKSLTPLSPEEIHKKLSEIDPVGIAPTEIALATIYRTLNHLVKADIIWKIYPHTRKRALFEIKPIFPISKISPKSKY